MPVTLGGGFGQSATARTSPTHSVVDWGRGVDGFPLRPVLGVLLVAEFKIPAPLITAHLLANFDRRFELQGDGTSDRGELLCPLVVDTNSTPRVHAECAARKA
jgi:hypothetical protein